MKNLSLDGFISNFCSDGLVCIYVVITSFLLIFASIIDYNWGQFKKHDMIDWLEVISDISMSLFIFTLVVFSGRGYIWPNIGVVLLSSYMFFKKTNKELTYEGQLGAGFWKVFAIFFAPVVFYAILSIFY